MLHKTLSIVVAAVVLTGCSFEDEGPEPVGEESLYQRLGTRETLNLQPTSLVGVMAYDKAGNVLPCVQPTVVNGKAVLRATTSGLVLVEGLEIELTDVKIDEGVLHSQDVVLTDIRLRLGTQLAFEPTWGDQKLSAVGGGQADLLLDWAVLDDSGEVYPLATQKLRKADFAVDINLDYDGTITANVTTAVEGELGNFANRISLADFSMAVNAKTPAPDVQ